RTAHQFAQCASQRLLGCGVILRAAKGAAYLTALFCALLSILPATHVTALVALEASVQQLLLAPYEFLEIAHHLPGLLQLPIHLLGPLRLGPQVFQQSLKLGDQLLCLLAGSAVRKLARFLQNLLKVLSI